MRFAQTGPYIQTGTVDVADHCDKIEEVNMGLFLGSSFSNRIGLKHTAVEVWLCFVS